MLTALRQSKVGKQCRVGSAVSEEHARQQDQTFGSAKAEQANSWIKFGFNYNLELRFNQDLNI